MQSTKICCVLTAISVLRLITCQVRNKELELELVHDTKISNGLEIIRVVPQGSILVLL